MNLKKQSENINRSYSESGETVDRIDSVQYQILDANGNEVGNANVYAGSLSANFNLSGFGSLAEGEERLEALFGELND